MSVTFTKLRWDERGLPHSVAFDDKYFCEENGYEESLHVFCGGNDLKARFGSLESEDFVVGETGFGTGLNFLCAWQLFETNAPANAKLHFISLDQFPLSPEDLKRALKLWPQLNTYSTQLIAQYSDITQDNMSVVFAGGRVRLTLIYDHVLTALKLMHERSYKTNAWFLDGFAPSKNKDMWSLEVFEGLARLSRSGTTIATFTVAGHVRRGLMEAGFKMEKVPAYGKKFQMLRGTYQ